MDLVLIGLVVLLLVLTVALQRSRRRQRASTLRLARAVGHPSTGRHSAAAEVAHLLAQLGMIADRKRTTITAPGLDGMYVLHVLPETIAIGYDTNRGRAFVGIAHSPEEAQRMVARHAELPAPA